MHLKLLGARRPARLWNTFEATWREKDWVRFDGEMIGSSLGQRNGGVPTWVDLAGIDPRDQTQGI